MMKLNIDDVFPNKLTADQTSRVILALRDTRNLLREELSYSPHVQSQTYVAFLRSHETKLLGLLNKNGIKL